MWGYNPCLRVVMWKRERIRRNNGKMRETKVVMWKRDRIRKDIEKKWQTRRKNHASQGLNLFKAVCSSSLLIFLFISIQIVVIWPTDRVCLGCIGLLHRDYYTVQLLNVSTRTFLHQSQIQSSQGIRVGIYSHSTGKNQFACKAALIIFCEVTGRGFKSLRISVLRPLHLTLAVLKHIAVIIQVSMQPLFSSALLHTHIITHIHTRDLHCTNVWYQSQCWDLNWQHSGHNLHL